MAYEEHWKLLQQVLVDHVEDNIVSFSDHAKQRMILRNVSKDMVDTILKYGHPTEMFEPYQYPYGDNPRSNEDPVFTVVGHAEYGKMAVGLAIQKKRGIRFRVITLFKVDMSRSRHAEQ